MELPVPEPKSLKPQILAIHAHPDDIEFQCAGTLALLATKGCSITLATMTPGDCGSADRDAETISTIRRQEARAAAELIGAEYFCLEFRDLAIFEDDESRRRVVEALRRVRPEIVLTAPPVDYLCDHEATSRLVRDACFAATLPNYKTRQWEPAPPLPKIPHLYYTDPIEGIDRDGQPQPSGFLVDVSNVVEIKRRMLACHASQRDWLLKQHGIDEYLDAQARWGSHRGAEIGVAHAEAFRQYLGHAYPRDNRLLMLLEEGNEPASPR
ncbi:PIG-L deacetylase family protein [Tundrisphaera lichenicola]|uniref:PIG-L deacetylase family protein n=1 Tax=Tundrisphaera lichenicola TaxID=2029860 RepID=UPI003EC0BC1F